MAEKRKLQQEVEKTLKRVEEGLDSFNDICEKAQGPLLSSSQKEKLETELKREIKKLQRFRDQIKTWQTSSDIKDKTPLDEARKKIEREMERFKVCEREFKMKAFSKEGLAAKAKLDPQEEERSRHREWLNEFITTLNTHVDAHEAEEEVLRSKKGKGGGGGRDSAQTERLLGQLQTHVQRHRWHINNMEQILRRLENDSVEMSLLEEVKESIELYIENFTNPDFYFDDTLYVSLNLDDVPEDGVSEVVKDSEEENGTSDPCGDFTPPSMAADPNTHGGSSGSPASSGGGGGQTGASSWAGRFSVSSPSSMNQTSGSAGGARSSSTHSRGAKGNNRHSGASTREKSELTGKPSAAETSSGAAPSSSSSPSSGGGGMTPGEARGNANGGHSGPGEGGAAGQGGGASGGAASSTAAPQHSRKKQGEEARSSSPGVVAGARLGGSHSKAAQGAGGRHGGEEGSGVEGMRFSNEEALSGGGGGGGRDECGGKSRRDSGNNTHTNTNKWATGVGLAGVAGAHGDAKKRKKRAGGEDSADEEEGKGREDAGPGEVTTRSLKQQQQQQQYSSNSEKSQKEGGTTGIREQGESSKAARNPPAVPPQSSSAVSESETSNRGSVSVHANGSIPSLAQGASTLSTIAALVDSSQLHCPTRMDGEQAPCASSLMSGAPSAAWPGGIFAGAAGPSSRPSVAPLSPQIPWSCAPDSFPDTPLAGFDSRHFFSKLDLDTLFFIFYYQQGTYQQYMAARELKRQSWRYHKKYLTWFQRHEEPRITADKYEQGTYVYFDYETGWCSRIKQDFTFEYHWLEDELLV